MVGRLLVGFVWLNLQISVSWQVDFLWGSCGSIFSFLCHGWQTFSGVRVAQSLVFCVMVGRLLTGFVWLNLQFTVSWLVDFQWGSCGSIFSFVSWQVDFQWGSCGSIFCFLCHGWQTFSGVRVAESLVFCVMVGRLLVGFVWLNLQFSVSWLVDFQWGSCGSIFRFLFYVSWLVDFQWGSCGSIFSFLCHGWQTFSGFRVAQSLVFCVMVGRLLVGFVWLNLQFSVSWLVDFSGLRVAQSLVFCGRQTFSGVRVAQSGFLVETFSSCGSWLVDFYCSCVSDFLVGFVWLGWGSCVSIFCVMVQTLVSVALFLVFCVMVGRLLVGFVWLYLQFSVSWLGRLLVCFVCLNLQFSVSWLVDFQWGSCVSWQVDFYGVRVAQSLVYCVMVGRLLVGFVWLNLQFSVSWQVDFQWVSCGSIQVFCVMVGRFRVGFVWLNLQSSVSWQVDFQWGSCGSIFSFLCHGWQTFSGVRVAQSLVFCVMVGRHLVGFVWFNLSFLWFGRLLVGSCLLVFCVMVGRLVVGFVRLNLQFSVSRLATFSGVRVAQSLVFCVMVGRLLVGFV